MSRTCDFPAALGCASANPGSDRITTKERQRMAAPVARGYNWTGWRIAPHNHVISAMRYQHLALALVFVGVGSMTAVSDEGMWLLNDAPKQQLKEKYKFDLSDEWLKNAMLASVRLN